MFNFNPTQILILCFSAPFILAMFIRALPSVIAPILQMIADSQHPQVKVVYLDRVVYQDVSVSKSSLKKRPSTSDRVKIDALNGLISLGMTKSEGKALIAKKTQQNVYSHAPTLLKDCLSLL